MFVKSKVLVFAESLEEAMMLIPAEIRTQVKEKILENTDGYQLLFASNRDGSWLNVGKTGHYIIAIENGKQVDITGIILKERDIKRLYLFIITPHPNLEKVDGEIRDVMNDVVGLEINYCGATYYLELQVPMLEVENGDNRNPVVSE